MPSKSFAPLPIVQPSFLLPARTKLRVHDIRAFLSTPLAHPPALENRLCAMFACREVLEKLLTVLPEDYALILQYNKSRYASRLCPACQRLYRLGDILPKLQAGPPSIYGMESPFDLLREQMLSGICSPICFFAAAFGYPEAIVHSFGHTADELDGDTLDILNRPPLEGPKDIMGLTLYMKMTRLRRLGLCQLDGDSDGG